MDKLKGLHGHVKETLKKVQEKPWAGPLGEALETSASVVGFLEGFVPGANVIGGALSFGATLLNPQPTLKDLQQQLMEIQKELETTSGERAKKLLQKEKQEILLAVEKVNKELVDSLQNMFDRVAGTHTELVKDITEIKDLILETLQHVVGGRFKVRTNCIFFIITNNPTIAGWY